VACVIREIDQLELCVSPTKSEVLGFYDDRHRGPPPLGLTIKIDKGKVMVGQRMKYLGLTIDGHWTFQPHIELLAPKVATAANALCGLLSNLGGAGLIVRRLYEGVIRSRILYGAPVWARELSASRRSLALVRGLQRVTAIRIIRGYRTVSYASATVLAASPPFELHALVLKERYESKRKTQQEGPEDTPRHVDLGEIQLNTWRRWHAWLEDEARTRPHWAVCAVLPNWEKWRDKNGIPLTFRMSQILTGHGVFGEFLKRIGKEITSVCHHCGTREDTAQHTLVACPAWEGPRRVLRTEVGEDLALEALIRAVLGGRQGYSAVRAFCEHVMLAKERAERERVRTGHPARADREERRREGKDPEQQYTIRSKSTRGVVPLINQI
jgi:hypothetical protein